MKKKLTISELQTISHFAAILIACNDIKPFSLANELNKASLAAEHKLKEIKESFDLINIRQNEAGDNLEAVAQCEQDKKDILSQKFEVELPDLKEESFINLDIQGEKEVMQQNGSVVKFNYREAYFNLLGLIID